MKKSIAAIALMASATSAYGIVGPGNTPRPQPKTYCLSLYENEDGAAYVGDCDNKARNVMSHAQIKENGCAEGQAALVTLKVKVKSCPTFVQL